MLKAKELKKGPRASAASGQAPEVSVKESEKPAKDVVDQMAALEWSQRQQKQFETALRLVDKNHPDRWGEIAKIVEGKSKKDCIQRFKEIRAKVLASKSAK